MEQRALTLVRPMFVYSTIAGSFPAETAFADGPQKVKLKTSSDLIDVFVFVDEAGTLAEPLSVAGANSNEGYHILRATFKSS